MPRIQDLELLEGLWFYKGENLSVRAAKTSPGSYKLPLNGYIYKEFICNRKIKH